MPAQTTQAQDAATLPSRAQVVPRAVKFTPEELTLLRASIAFHVQNVTDPALRARLEHAAGKLSQLAAAPRA